MSLLDLSCQCKSCLASTQTELDKARYRWKTGEQREILFKAWEYHCDDGCCDDYGTSVSINGFEVDHYGQNTENVLEKLLQFLEIENYSIETEYE